MLVLLFQGGEGGGRLNFFWGGSCYPLPGDTTMGNPKKAGEGDVAPFDFSPSYGALLILSPRLGTPKNAGVT